MPIGSSLTTVLLGLAAIFLGLAVMVKILQECWKYLLSTKAAAYERALFAYLGPPTAPARRPARPPRGRTLPALAPTPKRPTAPHGSGNAGVGA
jgi:hypothetical protein